MLKKPLIVIVSTVLTLLFLSLLGYYFIISNNDGTNNNTIVSGIKNFLPFGGNEYTPEPVKNDEDPQENNTPNESIEFTKKLRKISSAPVSGAGSADSTAGTIVRYIEKATGHIYEAELFSPKIVRISNTTIPLSYEAVWGDKNNSFIARYLGEDNETVDTFSMTIKSTSTSTENVLTGIQFPSKITEISVLNNSVFYLQESQAGTVGFTSGFDGKKIKEIWNSPIKELVPQYVNEKTILLNTKPLEGVVGFIYSVDTTNGSVKKILGDIPGLYGLSNDNTSKVLYLNQNTDVSMYIYDTATKNAISFYPVTFPEKCVWGTKNKHIIYCAVPKEALRASSLSDWYKGLVSFSDDIWKFDTKENTSSIILDLSKESGEITDVVKPILSTNEQYLLFVNKKDNSLWSLDLTK